MGHHRMTATNNPSLTLMSEARYILGDFSSSEPNEDAHGENELPSLVGQEPSSVVQIVAFRDYCYE